jgi:hypothetical protein
MKTQMPFSPFESCWRPRPMLLPAHRSDIERMRQPVLTAAEAVAARRAAAKARENERAIAEQRKARMQQVKPATALPH